MKAMCRRIMDDTEAAKEQPNQIYYQVGSRSGATQPKN